MIEYTGCFENYYEQGMAGYAVTFHDNRGLHGEHKQYYSFPWMIWFDDLKRKGIKKIDHITVKNKKGGLFYEGPLTLLRTRKQKKELMKGDVSLDIFYAMCSCIDFYFEELGFKKSYLMVHSNYPATFKLDYKVEALREDKDGGQDKTT